MDIDRSLRQLSERFGDASTFEDGKLVMLDLTSSFLSSSFPFSWLSISGDPDLLT